MRGPGDERQRLAPFPTIRHELRRLPSDADNSIAATKLTTAKLPCVINGIVYTLANISIATASTPNLSYLTLPIDGQNVTPPEECAYGIHSI